MVYGWLVLTFPFSLPIPLILTFGSSRAKIFLWLSGYNINIPLVYSLVYLLVLFSKDGHHRTPHPHDLIIHHAINILILGGDVYVPFPWIWEELVTSLTRRQRKWCCANFWANTFRNSQFPIPVLWDTESRKSATMQGETKYPLEEALCGCSDQQPLLSSQPIASTNCRPVSEEVFRWFQPPAIESLFTSQPMLHCGAEISYPQDTFPSPWSTESRSIIKWFLLYIIK